MLCLTRNFDRAQSYQEANLIPDSHDTEGEPRSHPARSYRAHRTSDQSNNYFACKRSTMCGGPAQHCRQSLREMVFRGVRVQECGFLSHWPHPSHGAIGLICAPPGLWRILLRALRMGWLLLNLKCLAAPLYMKSCRFSNQTETWQRL